MRLRTLAASAALLFGLGLTSALAQTRPPPIVTVTGEASIDVTPDLALVSAGMMSQGKTAREAAEANAHAMAPILAALKEGGVEDADVQTSQLSIQPMLEQNRGPGRVTGFQASNQVTVKVRDTAKVSDMVDRLVGAGANTLTGIEFVVSNPSSALDKVRALCLDDAKHKAEIYARASNAGLGRPLTISEDTPAPRFMRAGTAMAAATPIAVGQNTLRMTVSVTFELMY